MLQDLLRNMNLELLNAEVIVAALVFVAVLFVGISILFVREQRRKAATQALLETGRPEATLPAIRESRFLRFVERFGNYISHGRASTSLWEQLIRAGYMNRGAAAVYTGTKMLLFTAGLTGAAVVLLPLEMETTQKVLLISLGGAVPFFLPNMILRIQERKRREEIRLYLPDAVDLLEICVSSGIGLDMAWNMVSDEIQQVSPVLGTAMDLSSFEMHLGAARTEAMRNMATRTGADQLASLAAILVQSERFGTSVATALQEFARWMRDERQLTAEENAEKLPMKLLFPMAFFIFPAIMVVAVGPAFIHIFGTFTQL